MNPAENFSEDVSLFGKVAVVGLGALGIMYGDLLTRRLGTDRVAFVASPERVAGYRTESVECNGSPCHFAYATPEEFGTADLVIVAVKTTGLEAAMRECASIVGPETVIISLLNGITSEDVIESVIPRGTVIHCVSLGMDALRTARSIRYSKLGVLCLGAAKAHPERTEALNRLVRFFDAVGLPCRKEESIERRMWYKWMLNVGVNQTVAVYETTFETIQKEGPARDMMKAAMGEALLVAQAAGVDLTQDDLIDCVRIIDTLMPDGMPSLRQDLLAGRKTEYEEFSGAVIRKAKTFGIDVPVNQKLYDTITEIERTL